MIVESGNMQLFGEKNCPYFGYLFDRARGIYMAEVNIMMKKRISLLLVFAILLSMVNIPSTAQATAYKSRTDDENSKSLKSDEFSTIPVTDKQSSNQNDAIINIDGAYLTNNENADSHIASTGEQDVHGGVVAGDIGSVCILDYTYLHLQGWIADNDEFTDIGYQINDDEIVWGLGTFDQSICDIIGYTYVMRYNFNAPIDVIGQATLKILEKRTDGTAEQVHQIVYFGNCNEWHDISSNYAIGPYLKQPGDYAAAVFAANGAFSAIRIPKYWASNNERILDLGLYSFTGSIEDSINGTPIAHTEFSAKANSSSGISVVFPEVDQGAYVVCVRLLSVEGTGYFALPMEGNILKAEYLTTDNNKSFNFGVQAASSFEYGVYIGITVPDEAFRSYLLSNFDTDNNYILSDAEKDNAVSLEPCNLGIVSLKGINLFPDLTYLDCKNNQLNELDLSGISQLEYLDCSGNNLAMVDISACPALVDAVINGEIEETAQNVIYTLNQYVLITDKDVFLHTGNAEFDQYIMINEDNFPDEWFRNFVAQFDTDGSGSFDIEELAVVKAINIDYFPDDIELSSIAGIEYFFNLEELNISYPEGDYDGNGTIDWNLLYLGDTDLRSNKKLTSIFAYDVLFQSLNLDNLNSLKTVDFTYSGSDELDFSKTPNIESVRLINGQYIYNVIIGRADMLEEFVYWGGYGTLCIQYNLNLINKLYYSENYAGWEHIYFNEIDSSWPVTYYGEEGDLSFTIGDEISIDLKIPVDETVFPDAIFSNYVSENIDVNGDHFLDFDEFDAVQDISIENAEDLTGIELFRNLILLDCSGSDLSTLDLSHNLQLANAVAYGERIESGGVVTYSYGNAILIAGSGVAIHTGIPYYDDRIIINEDNFPDDNFREYVHTFDLNGDGGLVQNEIDAVTEIAVDGLGIETLDGIEFFTNLISLSVAENQLMLLDLTLFEGLNYLDCSGNPIVTLDLSAHQGFAEAVAYGTRTVTDSKVKNEKDGFTLITGADTELYTGIPYYDDRIIINEANFPDDNFREYVHTLDLNGDGGLVQNEIDAVTEIAVDGLGIGTLDGIEFFANLILLSVADNQLTLLELTLLEGLFYLDCSGNPIVTLDLSAHQGFAEAVAYGTRTVTDSKIKNEKDGFTLITGPDTELYTGIPYYDDRIIINEANFPDDNFREYVQTLDLNGDGGLVQNEIDAVTEIVIGVLGIEDIKGIEYFTNLIYLDCSENPFDILDISFNQGLAEAVAYGERTVEGNKVKHEKDGFVLITDSMTVLHTGISSYDDRVIINSAFFPDDIFREYVRLFDLNGDNGLTEEELELVTEINVDGMEISSLVGIELFSNLTVLSCRNNDLAELIIEANVLLEQLYCEGNAIETIFVGDNPNLETVLRNAAVITTEGIEQYSYGDGAISVSAGTLLLTGDTDFDNRLPVDEVHFPDANFRIYIAEVFNLGERSYLYESEYVSLSYINVDYHNIVSLKGIEYFTGLIALNCGYNQLSELDLSENVLLEQLYCDDNQLAELNLSANSLLVALTCSNNQLTELDLSANTLLTSLNCRNNQLAELDLSSNVLLTYLDCTNNRILYHDFSTLSELQILQCGNNIFKVLDLSNKTQLSSLSCTSEFLETLIVDGCTSLTQLYERDGSLVSVSARNCTSLSYIDCYNNLIETLDVSGCVALTELYVSNNKLPDLDLSGLNMLQRLECYYNTIKNLKVDGCSSLSYLHVSNNKIKNLDLTDCVQLRELRVYGNSISMLDISECTYLRNDYLKGRTNIGLNSSNIFTGVEINEENYPDDIFRSYVAENFDINGSSILNLKEIDSAETIDLSNAGVASLAGLEYLNKVITLRVSGNPISGINLAGQERLSVLACQDTDITELEISDSPNLVDAYMNGTVSSESVNYIVYDSEFGYIAIDRAITLSIGIPIDEEHFPDDIFRSFVQAAYDTNTNGYLGQTERESVSYVSVNGKGIISLEGLSFFKNIKTLDCSNNQLDQLDLSAFSELTNLYCNYCGLTSLDLSANTKLISLSCEFNSITELDLSNNAEMSCLACRGNGMTKLNILNCEKLIIAIREGEKTSTDEYDHFNYSQDFSAYLWVDKTLKISTGNEPATVYGLSSTLDGTVKMNIYLVLPDFIIEDPAAYVLFSKDGSEKIVMVADVIDSPTTFKDGTVAYGFSNEIVAKEFRDIVNVKLFDGTGRSIQLITRTNVDYGTDGYRYPLSRYLLDRINNSDSENMRNLAQAMLDYGSAAQLYFDYNVDDTIVVTNAVSGIQYSEFDPYESMKSDDADKPDGFIKNSFSLVLEGDTSLKMYYSFESGIDPFSYHYYIDGNEAVLHKEGSKYFLIVEDIIAKELDVAHEFTISNGEKSYSIISSALSYARYLAGQSAVNKQNLGKAILVYNRMAKDYFNSLSNN